ncbi:MAG: carbon-nitrogen hydrolase family protein, partial [Deltaproteobacteria bacterium]|nr:carbon-nitrogen hydrolase family protein [Deltaproteobacteria bacterium]
MKVGIVQMSCSVGDVKKNIAAISCWTEKAKLQGCDLVVFPEMSDTGYEMAAIRENADSWERGQFAALQQIAAKSKLFLASGISEREKDQIFNSLAVLGPDGTLIGKYRKT